MSEVVLNRVSKHYGSVAAVRDFSFTVQQGEFVALLGPSGCGKTTTLRMIAGFIPVSSGRITIGAKDVTHVPPHRRNTGMVFQGYALFPHMTVAQNVAFGLEMRRIPKAEAASRVEQALKLVRLEGYGERYPRQLSGGQQQRVALARALVVQPEVFLLDEPLSNLDAKLRHDVRIEIRQLQRKLGLTTVFVTHDQEEALTVADRLIVMNKGEIEQIGTPEELYNRPRTYFVADFLGKSNFFPGTVEGGDLFRTKAGTPLRLASTPAVGASLVAVRPEKLRLAPADAPVEAPNKAAGRVELVTFLGAVIETTVRLGSGETLVVHSQNQTSDRHYPVGADVLVYWDADANLVLEEPAPEPA